MGSNPRREGVQDRHENDRHGDHVQERAHQQEHDAGDGEHPHRVRGDRRMTPRVRSPNRSLAISHPKMVEVAHMSITTAVEDIERRTTS